MTTHHLAREGAEGCGGAEPFRREGEANRQPEGCRSASPLWRHPSDPAPSHPALGPTPGPQRAEGCGGPGTLPRGPEGAPSAPEGPAPVELILEALEALGEPLVYELAARVGAAVAIVERRLRELQAAGRAVRAPGPDGRWRWRAAHNLCGTEPVAEPRAAADPAGPSRAGCPSGCPATAGRESAAP